MPSLRDATHLSGRFRDRSIFKLQQIFDETENDSLTKDIIKNLNHRLFSILLHEKMSCGVTLWKISTSGQNHIFISSDICILLNIYGYYVLMSDALISEGEMTVSNFHWIENDNLVVFDIIYIVHRELQKCVCHYSNDNDSFIVRSSVVKQDIDNIFEKKKYNFGIEKIRNLLEEWD